MFSMFRSKSTPKPIITVEETEKFLRDQIILIQESEGVDPNSFSIMFGKDRSREENMRRIANEIKWAINNRKQTISFENVMQCDTDVLVSEIFAKKRKEKDYSRMIMCLLTVFGIYQSILGDELKKNFLHNFAVSLHKVAKDLVSKNGGWVETYIEEAEAQAIRNLIEANRENVEFLVKAVKICIVAGIGLFALFRWGLTEEVAPGITNAFKM